jgi:hypothetical protein
MVDISRKIVKEKNLNLLETFQLGPLSVEFTKLLKGLLASCPSVRPLGTTRFPLDGF